MPSEKCPGCGSENYKDITIKRCEDCGVIPIWIVWVYERDIGTSIRAIDTTFDLAKRHKAMFEHEALSWGKEKKVRVTIEKREANHAFAAGALSRIFQEGG